MNTDEDDEHRYKIKAWFENIRFSISFFPILFILFHLCSSV